MPEISPISDDWVQKGFHIRIGAVELKVRPTHDGNIILKSVFSSTRDGDLNSAIKIANYHLNKNRSFVEKLLETAKKAKVYLAQNRTELEELARGRSGEMRFLEVCLIRKLEEIDG